MGFSDADQAAIDPVDDAIGIAQRIGGALDRWRRDRPRLPAAVLAIESLIRVVREIDVPSLTAKDPPPYS
jgi:hypothetical protein